MLILRKMLAKKMKDESSYLHRQLGMQVSSFGKTGNNPHTYNCDELYMASPLEKSRELAVLIITQNIDCLVLFYGSCWTTCSYQGGCQKEEDQKVWRVRNRREGVQIGLSLNSANRKKTDGSYVLSSVFIYRGDLLMYPVLEPYYDYHVT